MMSTKTIKPLDYRYRKYQIDLYESAKDENTIVVLGTGTGKTMIALMLISDDQFAKQLSGGYISGAAKRTFFLAPTRPLAKQQELAIRSSPLTCHLSVKSYVGQMDEQLGAWDKSRWDQELEQTQVLVMTPQILLNLLNRSYITFERMNLLIIDEVHWAARKKLTRDSGHPYKSIMKLYGNGTPEQRPRVLGLSATPINCTMKVSGFDFAIKDIERTYFAVCKTADVGQHGTNPKEGIVTYSVITSCRSPSASTVCHSLDIFLNTMRKHNNIKNYATAVLKVKKCLTNIRNMLATPTNFYINDNELGMSFPVFMSWMGVWCSSVCTEKYIEELLEQKDLIIGLDSNQYLLIDCTMNYFQLLRDVFESELKSDPMAILNTISPKMHRLLELLRRHRPTEDSSSNFCAIVFVNQRCVAKVLAEWLKRLAKVLPEECGFLRVGWVVGHSHRPEFEGKFANHDLAEEQQKNVLTKFYKEELNLLVATSVLEEGLDVRHCNLVIKYDGLNTFREYLQARGRARATDAHFYILTTDADSSRLQNQLRDFRYMEERLKYINRPDKENFLRPESAITLLYKYCKSLRNGSDPTLEVKREKFGYRGIVTLPSSCPLNEVVEGKLDYDREMAKMLAAVKACQKLQTFGELDQHFLPMSTSSECKRKFSAIEESEPKWPEELLNPTKRMRTECTIADESLHVPIIPTDPRVRRFGDQLQVDGNNNNDNNSDNPLVKSLISKTEAIVIKVDGLVSKCTKRYCRDRFRRTFGRRKK